MKKIYNFVQGVNEILSFPYPVIVLEVTVNNVFRNNLHNR